MTELVFKIISASVGALGLLFTIYITIVRKNNSNPKIKLTVGYLPMKTRFKIIRTYNKKHIINVFEKAKTKHPIVCIPIRIENAGNLACSNIVVRISHPLNFKIADSVFISQKELVKISVPEAEKEPDSQKVIFLGDSIQIEYKLDTLRIGESTMITHLMRAEPDTSISQSDEDFSHYVNRYSAISGFLSSANLYVGVFSPDFNKVETTLDVINLNCASIKETRETIDQISQASWDGQKPPPGFYFIDPISKLSNRSYRFSKIMTPTYVELSYLDIGIDDITPKNLNTLYKKIRSPKLDSAILFTPPWGFFGESFNLREFLITRYKPKTTTTYNSR